ncbi:MAG: quinone-dependent dihydroorotate dehydrogenase [Ornithinimicrobium sp.]
MSTPRGRVVAAAYTRVAKPVLFRLDPERAHHLSLRAAAAAGHRAPARRALSALMAVDGPAGPGVDLWGLHFPNRLGLAAGMDKNGVAVPAWQALGFGHVEVGTVTAVPQPGNSQPRLVRLSSSGALINRMGFNNDGAVALAQRLRTDREQGLVGIPVGVSLGKSKITDVEFATQDYVASLAAVRDVADYIAVNVSSPNTPGLRSLQDAKPLRELLTALVASASGTPVLVKLAPDLSDAATDEALQVATDAGIVGIIASNTTLSRDLVHARDAARAQESGGLSGSPLTLRSRAMVARIVKTTDFPVIGVGGVMQVQDAAALLDVGAALVQVYTGLVYGGPSLVRGIRVL